MFHKITLREWRMIDNDEFYVNRIDIQRNCVTVYVL